MTASRDGADRCDTDKDRITTIGLLLESASGVRRVLEPTLACAAGAGAPWFEVMLRLSRSPGVRLRMSDLAAQTQLSPSGLTRAIDRLVELGLVERSSCPSDRRGSYAELTAAGMALMNQALPRHRAALDGGLEGLFDPGEEAALQSALRKLRDRVLPGAMPSPELG
ncbi:MAG TPA: MarR family transcriptional regulator [Acidimicrobiales bacterium]|nr:MarR family transcriptional regulator [Acidimicrobiales bacterium]